MLGETSKAVRLAELRAHIRRLEGGNGSVGGAIPLGVAAIDEALPDGGLPGGCVHELTGGDAGTATAFAAAALSRVATATAKPALWIVRGRDLYAPGLAFYGLTPDRLIAARVRNHKDLLWAMEEALRCRGVSAVLGEAREIDLTASRRLQLAAETGGTVGILLLGEPQRMAAASSVTRWRVSSLPGVLRPGEPGVPAERWRVELLRCRGGRPGEWTLEWREGKWFSVGGDMAAKAVFAATA